MGHLMAINLDDVEAKLQAGMHAVLADIKAAEPTIDVAFGDALAAAGAPPEIVQPVQALLSALLGHFTAVQNAQAPADPPA